MRPDPLNSNHLRFKTKNNCVSCWPQQDSNREESSANLSRVRSNNSSMISLPKCLVKIPSNAARKCITKARILSGQTIFERGSVNSILSMLKQPLLCTSCVISLREGEYKGKLKESSSASLIDPCNNQFRPLGVKLSRMCLNIGFGEVFEENMGKQINYNPLHFRSSSQIPPEFQDPKAALISHVSLINGVNIIIIQCSSQILRSIQCNK